MGALACIFIKHSMHKIAEKELAKRDHPIREALDEYGKVLANLFRKVFAG